MSAERDQEYFVDGVCGRHWIRYSRATAQYPAGQHVLPVRPEEPHR
jgi:hypothetical protein